MTRNSGSAKPKRGLTDSQFALFLIIPLVIFQAALSVYPGAVALWMSLQKFNPSGQVMRFYGAGNYIKAFADPDVQASTLISLEYTVTIVVVTVLLGLGVSLLLNEQFKGRSIIRVLVILPWAIPEYATALLYGNVYSQTYGTLNGLLMGLGLIPEYLPIISIGTIWVLALAYAWHYAPLAIFFFLGSLQSVPEHLYQQARIDGASVFRRFRTVTLPYMRYALLIILVLATTDALRSLDLVWNLTQGGPNGMTRVLTYYVYRATFVLGDLGYGAALSFILMILIMLVTAVYFILLTRRRR